MSTIDRMTGLERLDSDSIERGIQAGRRLRAQAFRAALASLFSRERNQRPKDEAARLPDCTATA